MILIAHIYMCGQSLNIFIELSKDAGLLPVQMSLMGHSSAASAPAGELMGQIVFSKFASCQVGRGGIKESLHF